MRPLLASRLALLQELHVPRVWPEAEAIAKCHELQLPAQVVATLNIPFPTNCELRADEVSDLPAH